VPDDLEIRVRVWPCSDKPRPQPHGPDVEGLIRVPIVATDPADAEENAVRLAEQMVRSAFARLRAQTHVVVAADMGGGRVVHLVKSAASARDGERVTFRGPAAACVLAAQRANG
jgi:hypothetical protein